MDPEGGSRGSVDPEGGPGGPDSHFLGADDDLHQKIPSQFSHFKSDALFSSLALPTRHFKMPEKLNFEKFNFEKFFGRAYPPRTFLVDPLSEVLDPRLLCVC